LRDAFASVVK